MNGFIQFNRNQEEIKLFALRPTAFLLLAIIVQRAKWNKNLPNKQLEVGEAYIGDWKSYCRSREIYRNDVKFLVKHQKATIKTTNKGTLAKIISTSPFNINSDTATITLTNKPPSSHHQATTNKKEKRRKGENNTHKNSLNFENKNSQGTQERVEILENKNNEAKNPTVKPSPYEMPILNPTDPNDKSLVKYITQEEADERDKFWAEVEAMDARETERRKKLGR